MRTGLRAAKVKSSGSPSNQPGSESSRLLHLEKMVALGELVSAVAHELSNPLTSILGYAQKLLSKRASPDTSNDANQILHEAERAIAILGQVLSSAREPERELKLVSLNQIVLRSIESERERFLLTNIRVQLDLDSSLPLVRGDAGRLQQVILNLLRNARQAIQGAKHDGTISLRARAVKPEWVSLEVADSGPGIPAENLSRIFDAFFTTKPPGEGTGLGLAIASSIAREHGGEIRATNAESGGAIFQLLLPAPRQSPADFRGNALRSHEVKQDSGNRGVAGLDGDLARQSAAAMRGKRVLVVEDEPTVARLIGEVLEEAGMRVDVATNAREALKTARSGSHDLVICDIKMPEVDGREIFKLLTGEGRVERKKFIFVTGDIVTAGTREFLEGNALTFVAKPFRLEELMEKVRAMFDRENGDLRIPARQLKKLSAKSERKKKRQRTAGRPARG